MFVDSHCHLNYPEFEPLMDQIRQDMHKAQGRPGFDHQHEIGDL